MIGKIRMMKTVLKVLKSLEKNDFMISAYPIKIHIPMMDINILK